MNRIGESTPYTERFASLIKIEGVDDPKAATYLSPMLP